ncbi:hypothetical protein HETIRDRAFT_390437, partial [Heterobasidion irregulare TC 32-1]
MESRESVLQVAATASVVSSVAGPTTSRCVPGGSSCLSCYNELGGHQSLGGHAAFFFFFLFLADHVLGDCKSLHLYARVGSEGGWTRCPQMPHCGTRIFSSPLPSGKFSSLVDLWSHSGNPLRQLACRERARRSTDAGAESPALVRRRFFSCDCVLMILGFPSGEPPVVLAEGGGRRPGSLHTSSVWYLHKSIFFIFFVSHSESACQ